MRSEAQVAEQPTDLGATLRQQRELAGLSEQQVAEQLNLDAVTVTALEQDDFASLGAPVFARGHLKRYAGLLGLAEQEILSIYDRSRARIAQPTLIPKSRAEMSPERRPSRWPWLVGGLILFLLAAAVTAYVREHGLRLPGRAGAETVEAPVVPAAPDPGSPGATGAGATSPATTSPPAAVPVAAPDRNASAPPADAAAQAGQVALALAFAADSWVEIYDGSGKAVLYDLGKAGTERVVTGAAPLSVTFGNAPAVTVRVDGRPLTLPAPPAGQTVSRFSVGADGSLR
jgi:cytoskeleton protein RodZ